MIHVVPWVFEVGFEIAKLSSCLGYLEFSKKEILIILSQSLAFEFSHNITDLSQVYLLNGETMFFLNKEHFVPFGHHPLLRIIMVKSCSSLSLSRYYLIHQPLPYSLNNLWVVGKIWYVDGGPALSSQFLIRQSFSFQDFHLVKLIIHPKKVLWQKVCFSLIVLVFCILKLRK